uniref:Uncharacterized protein n=1 Tax=Arundo donax TaxID=35708 RepID=A0A0A9ABA2_ARUDO
MRRAYAAALGRVPAACMSASRSRERARSEPARVWMSRS